MILGISTSLSQFCVTLNDGQKLVYHHEAKMASGGKSSIVTLVTEALKAQSLTVSSLQSIIVDIGPGGTSSVRTGVAFGNGLAYSLGIPIMGVSSATLMGIEAYQQYQRPVAILFKSVKKHYYCGIYENGQLTFQYDTLEALASYIEQYFEDIVLAGNLDATKKLATYLTKTRAYHTDIQKVNTQVLGGNPSTFGGTSSKYPILPTPINEENLV